MTVSSSAAWMLNVGTLTLSTPSLSPTKTDSSHVKAFIELRNYSQCELSVLSVYFCLSICTSSSASCRAGSGGKWARGRREGGP